jgi:hypothetical protein
MISCLIRGIGLTVFFISEFSVLRKRREVFVPDPDKWYKYRYFHSFFEFKLNFDFSSYPKSEGESVSDENLILLTALVPLMIHGFALSFLSSSGNYSSKKQIKEEFMIHLLFLLNRK